MGAASAGRASYGTPKMREMVLPTPSMMSACATPPTARAATAAADKMNFFMSCSCAEWISAFGHCNREWR
ncbi:hypothetical protein HK414_19525 [Ramlibacter terrae]|uniref:Uncharacterized protein n=1 Tax=Ramlibacter terrae TaxID=2732511 RepID=A0ABX6P4A6_9BURK|nr:hypothetical protein HK414_19525 [Ramlibacter terrae]